jgi:hypothetical protein
MPLALGATLGWARPAHAQGSSAAAGEPGPSPEVKACLDATEQGQKLRDGGAYRRARERFIACAEEQCPGEVRKSCVGWLEDLDKLMPTVVFAASSRGVDVSDVRVTVDGERDAERIDGKPVSLDPGEHRFRFERDGEEPVEQALVIRAGEKERLLRVRFGPEPAPATPAMPPQASPPAQPASPVTFYALVAAGAAAVVAGAALDTSGYVYLQQCSGDPTCSGGHERAEVQWRFVTGDLLLGAGVACGVAAWLLRPHDARSSAARRPALVGVAPATNGVTLQMNVAF